MALASEEPLNEKQLRFAQEYAVEPNGARAYMRAYRCKSYNTAKNQCRVLLQDPRIKAEIAAAREEWSRNCRVNFQRVLRKLASVAFGDLDDLYEADPDNCGLPRPRAWDDIPPHARKNMTNVRVKRTKMKSDPDCITVIEELEYKKMDPMTALLKLCDYLNITKGAMAPDELRAYVAGLVSQATGTGPAPAAPAGSEGVGTGDNPLAIEHVK